MTTASPTPSTRLAAGGSALGYADADLGDGYAATDTFAKTDGDAKVRGAAPSLPLAEPSRHPGSLAALQVITLAKAKELPSRKSKP